MQKQAQFRVRKETPGTIQFKEVASGDGSPPICDTLYVKKWAVPDGTETLTVTIQFGDES